MVEGVRKILTQMEDEKMEEKDREIWIGENRMYLGEDNILYITTVGPIDTEIAGAIKEAVKKLKDMSKGKFNVLVDINKAGKASSTSRKTFKEMTEEKNIGKVALFGMHPVARVLASFVIGVSNNKDMRFFKTREEALAWLKE